MMEITYKVKIGGKRVLLPIFAVSEQDARDKLKAWAILHSVKIRQYKRIGLDNTPVLR